MRQSWSSQTGHGNTDPIPRSPRPPNTLVPSRSRQILFPSTTPRPFAAFSSSSIPCPSICSFAEAILRATSRSTIVSQTSRCGRRDAYSCSVPMTAGKTSPPSLPRKGVFLPFLSLPVLPVLRGGSLSPELPAAPNAAAKLTLPPSLRGASSAGSACAERAPCCRGERARWRRRASCRRALRRTTSGG